MTATTTYEISDEGFDPKPRKRQTNVVGLMVRLPPDIALTVQIVARKAGMTPESLVTDILRDCLEGTMSGRGQLAVEGK